MDEYLGMIKLFVGNYAPRGWAICDGRLLPINQYNALFSIIGITYGGDGRSNFTLPDLRGRVPLGTGQGPGLTNKNAGAKGGVESVALTINNMPAHSHTLTVSNEKATDANPQSNYLANASGELVGVSMGETVEIKSFAKKAGTSTLNDKSISAVGGSLPLDNMPPYLVMNYVICIEGLYPGRD